MPYPLPKGHQFCITYLNTDASHTMPVMCAAYDFYEMSILLSGDRKSITPDAVYFMHTGSVTLTAPGLLHQSSSTSESSIAYRRILIKFSIKIADTLRQMLGAHMFEELCTEHVLYFSPEHTELITRMFFDMLDEYELDTAVSETLLTGMLARLLVSINR